MFLLVEIEHSFWLLSGSKEGWWPIPCSRPSPDWTSPSREWSSKCWCSRLLCHRFEPFYIQVMRCHRQLFSLAFGGLQHMLLGLMAAAFPVLPMGLLHMRPLLWWTKLLGIFLTGPASHLIKVSHSCFCALSIWWDPLFLQRGVSVGTAPCYQMVTMDASLGLRHGSSHWEQF